MNDLKDSKILITGGTGFFGRSLLRQFIDKASTGAKLTILSRNPGHFLSTHPEFDIPELINYHKGDIQDYSSLPSAQSFTYILHAATDSTYGPLLTPLQRFDQILNGTRNILDLAVATGAQRFLLTSSGGIYGAQPLTLEAIPENYQAAPPLHSIATAYSQAKRAAEHLCALYQVEHGLEVVIARCFAFVGPDLPLDVHFAIGNFIRDALSRDSITVSGDGTPLRTYLDQDDLAHWLLTLLQQGHPGEAYNVGSDEVISIADLAHRVRDILSPEKPVHILGQPDPGAARNRYIPDIRKVQRDLGLNVTIPLSQAIRRAGEAQRQRMGIEGSA